MGEKLELYEMVPPTTPATSLCDTPSTKLACVMLPSTAPSCPRLNLNRVQSQGQNRSNLCNLGYSIQETLGIEILNDINTCNQRTLERCFKYRDTGSSDEDEDDRAPKRHRKLSDMKPRKLESSPPSPTSVDESKLNIPN